jgi:hypothetical protein
MMLVPLLVVSASLVSNSGPKALCLSSGIKNKNKLAPVLCNEMSFELFGTGLVHRSRAQNILLVPFIESSRVSGVCFGFLHGGKSGLTEARLQLQQPPTYARKKKYKLAVFTAQYSKYVDLGGQKCFCGAARKCGPINRYQKR